ncbi:MAG: hypothetical protein VSS75_014105 [Candidatus Parabeggiatoa sp.]|nr:hypothetical protein [Candidatus Parabeggiatoa sp.]
MIMFHCDFCEKETPFSLHYGNGKPYMQCECGQGADLDMRSFFAHSLHASGVEFTQQDHKYILEGSLSMVAECIWYNEKMTDLQRQMLNDLTPNQSFAAFLGDIINERLEEILACKGETD